MREYFPTLKRQPLIAGQPASLTAASLNDILAARNAKGESPYLVCQKSKGVRYLLLVARVCRADLLREPPLQEQTYTQCYFLSSCSP